MKLCRSTVHRLNKPAVMALALAYWRLDADRGARIAERKRKSIDRFLADLEMDRILGASEQFELVRVEVPA